MTKIQAADVAKLRRQTGAGMMDCKKALIESDGDFDNAITVLRKKGQKVAAQRADRETSQGIAVVKINESMNSGVAIVLACETDFVAKNDSFKELANSFANVAISCEDKESFLNADFDGMTVAEKLIEQTGVIGEKLDISSFEKLDAPYVGSYTHGLKIAVLVGLSKNIEKADILAKDLSMQVASMGATTLSYKDFTSDYLKSETDARIAVIEKENIELQRLGKTLKNVPTYISMSQLTSEILSKAEEEIKTTLKNEGKPEHIWDKIVPGKMTRFILDNTTLDQEQCLLDQIFIKDENKKVSEYINSYDNNVSVIGFKRVSLG